MRFFKFELNSIIYLSVVVLTIIGWVAFEFYHRSANVDVNPTLVEHSKTPLPNSFDEETLKKFYKSKDKFYETQNNTSQ